MLESPFRITFDTNPDDCNLHCDMCEGHSQINGNARSGFSKRRMPFPTIQNVLHDLRDCPPREIIPSTMGEPLLYRDFDKIIELCSTSGIKLNLTTNGTFPRGGVEYWAERLLPICSDIKVSFNGIKKGTQEAIMKGAEFEEVKDNLLFLADVRKRLRSNGLKCGTLTLQPTFREKNLEEIPLLLILAQSIGFERVKGHHLWVHDDSMACESLLRSPDSRRRWNETARFCASLVKVWMLSGREIRLVNFEPVPVEVESGEVQADWVCPFLGREMWVNTEGRFDVCCAPDDLRRTLGDFGNVLERDVLDLWRSQEYSELCENYRSRDICKSCLLRRSEV